MNLRNRFKVGALLLISFCFFACSEQEAPPATENDSDGVSSTNAVAEVHFWIGGGTSPNLESNPEFHASVFNLYVFRGTNAVVKGGNTNIDEFNVGAESSEGKAILRLIAREKPWNWENPLGHLIPFADHLTLFGQAHGRKFDYDSVYPDPKLAKLTRDLRKVLTAGRSETPQ